MARVMLRDLCAVRSGDKGDIADLSLFADDEPAYAAICAAVTESVVAEHFAGMVEGSVTRYEAANVLALKFVMERALGGGAPRSLRADNLGKTLGASLLRLEIDVPEAVAASATRGERAPLPRGPHGVKVRAFTAGDDDHAWAVDRVGATWGWPVVSPGGVYGPDEAAARGFVAYDDRNGERVGLLTWRDDETGREIVALEAVVEHGGVGRALMDAASQDAGPQDAPGRIWLATTDTNIRAIDFYQRWGMDLVELRRHFVDEVRRHKPGVTDFRHILIFERVC